MHPEFFTAIFFTFYSKSKYNPLMTTYDPMLSSDPVLHTDLQSQMVYFENPENIANLSYESDATKQDAEVG